MAGGFGRSPFGSGLFGEAFWEEQVLWLDMPERRRNRDTEDGESFMLKFFDSLQPSVRRLRHSIRDFFSLRDPWTCRTRFDSRHEIEFVDIEEHDADDPDERWLSLYIEGDPIEDASRTWVIESQDTNFKRWVVERVYKLDSSETVTNVDNWRVVIQGTEDPPVVGTKYWFHPEEQLPSLAADFGIDLDQYFEEDRQRSQVLHHDERRQWKGTQVGYEQVCKLYGFTVSLTHLWRIRCGFETTVAALGYDVWEIPVGSGKYYTDRAPTLPVFDEVAADVIPADTFCDELGFTSVIPLGPFPISSISTFTTPYTGFDVLLVAPPTAFDAVAWPGHWRVEVPDGSGGFYNYYLESLPIYLGANTWQLTFSGGGSVLPSGTLRLNYACPVWLNCCYCGTHKISVELEYDPLVSLTDRERLYVFERVVDELYDNKPIHVEFARFALKIYGEASLDLRAILRKGISKKLVAGMSYLYDVIEGDAIPADSYSLTATLTK